jgi:hypothetical protein
MPEPFPGPIPPPVPPLAQIAIIDEQGRATAVLAEWLAKLMHFLSAPHVLRMQDTYDPPALLTFTSSPEATMTVAGAQVGDAVVASFSQPLQGLALNAWVSSPDTVTYQFVNSTAGTIDLPSGTVRIRVGGI